MQSDPTSHDAAVKLARARMSPRARRLEALEQFVDCTQYAERNVDWLDNSSDVPLWERRPCIVYPIVSSAITSNVDLVLGEGRFPEITSRPDEDDEDWDESGLDEDDSETVDKFLADARREARFKQHAREVLANAQGCGTAVGLFGVRAGRLFAETTRARWCEPELDADGNVTKLTIEYPYLDQYQEPGSRAWKWRAMLYRRELDATSDITFKPFEIRNEDDAPNWQPDPAKTAKHGFGFCPVLWYPFLRGTSTVNVIDGTAIHAHCLDEIRAHDYVLSSRHRSALFVGDPQIYEIGVPLGYCPTETGRMPGIETLPVVDKSTGDVVGEEPMRLGGSTWRSSGAGKPPARKKGPGYVWQYADPQTKVDVLTLPPEALKALDENAHDLRQKIAESLCVVLLDPENIKFAATVSGKALETLRQRQLDRCDQIRDDFGERYLIPSQLMLLRIAAHYRQKGQLRTRGIDKVRPLLERFTQKAA